MGARASSSLPTTHLEMPSMATAQSGVTIYNSPANIPMGTIVAVPGASMMTASMTASSHDQVVRIAPRAAVTLHAEHYLWFVPSIAGSAPRPLTSSHALPKFMNWTNQNQQTMWCDNSTGAVFFKTTTHSGAVVFVFGRMNDVDGTAPTGVYEDSMSGLTWRTTGCMAETAPPGFTMIQTLGFNDSQRDQKTNGSGRTPGPSIEYVVARFAEDLQWLLQPPFASPNVKVSIYNKGPPLADDFLVAMPATSFSVTALPNIGREFHTFLTHIVTRLQHPGSLADITIFLPGSTWAAPHKREMLQGIFEQLPRILPKREACFPEDEDLCKLFAGFSMTHYGTSNPQNAAWNRDSEMHLAEPRPFENWFRHVIQSDMEGVGPVGYCGVLAASRRTVEHRPMGLYRRLLDALSVGPNPEAGHYVERVWATLLRPR